MPGFCASIVLAFILRVELFDYVVDGGICERLAGGRKPNDGRSLKMGGIKPSGRHGVLMVTAVFCCKLTAIDGKIFCGSLSGAMIAPDFTSINYRKNVQYGLQMTAKHQKMFLK